MPLCFHLGHRSLLFCKFNNGRQYMIILQAFLLMNKILALILAIEFSRVSLCCKSLLNFFQ